MKLGRVFPIHTIILLLVFSSCNAQPKNNMAMDENVFIDDRQPVVAGRFYPGSAEDLSANLKELFTEAKNRSSVPAKDEETLAILTPHAGYVYSGIVAAAAFLQVNPDKKFKTVFVMGSSHVTSFNGASIYNQGDYITPLGKVKVNLELANQLIDAHSCFSYVASAHTQEHSLEVELPFLQYHLKQDFQIIPIVVGTQDKGTIEKISATLKPYFKEENLFVISTDFSHYPNYEDAQLIDRLTAESICKNDPNALLATLKENTHKSISNLATSLCGWTSVLALLNITKEDKTISYTPVLYQNSGDAKYYGERSRVVGYYAIKATKKKIVATKEVFRLSEKEKQVLLGIARNTLDTYITNHNIPDILMDDISSNLQTHAGAFVTLRKKGQLRGCIGRFEPDIPLYQVVQNMAIAAATKDYRFPAVQPDELNDIHIEISVLTPLRKIDDIHEIELAKHGIYIKKGMQSGTFLPQVATSTGWSLEEFLGHCAKDKARIGWEGWKEADIFIYEAIIFEE